MNSKLDLLKIAEEGKMATMAHTSKWHRILAPSCGEPSASALLSKAQLYYDQLWIQHSDEPNRARRASLKSRILPGLSIYKAMLEAHEDREKALAQVDILFRAAFFTRMVKGIRVLNFLPNPFLVVRPVLKRMTQDEYMPGAQEIVEDSPDCFAVNVYRCFILDTLAAHNAQELTGLFCNTDNWLAEVLPKVDWQRTKTLGRGDDCCDFRWCRIK